MILKNIKDIEPDKILIKKPYTFYFVEIKDPVNRWNIPEDSQDVPEVSPDDIFYTFSGNFNIRNTDTFISEDIIGEELNNKSSSWGGESDPTPIKKWPVYKNLEPRYAVCGDVIMHPIRMWNEPCKQIKVTDHFEIYVYWIKIPPPK